VHPAIVYVAEDDTAQHIAEVLPGHEVVVIERNGAWVRVFANTDAPDERPLAERAASSVRRLLQDGCAGDLLVFLPGAGEIRRTWEALESVAASKNLLVLPLHGDLSPAEQQRAVRPDNHWTIGRAWSALALVPARIRGQDGRFKAAFHEPHTVVDQLP